LNQRGLNVKLVHSHGLPDAYPPAKVDASNDLRVCTAFREVATALAEGRGLDQVLHVIAEKLCELTGHVRCSIHLVDPESGLLRGQAGHAPTDIDARVRRLVSGGPGDGFTREVIATRRPVAVVDTLSDPRAVRSAMRQWNARSVLGVAMILGDEVVGMVCLDDESTTRTFSDEEQEVVVAFAGLAATAVKQAQLTSQLKSSLSVVARQVEQLKQASQLERSLTEIVLRGCSLREIGETVARLLGKPCAIYNAQFRQLALSRGTIPVDSCSRLLDAKVRAVPEVARLLNELRPGVPETVEPVPAAGLHQRLLVSSVALGDQLLGYLTVAEQGSPLSLLDEAVVLRAAASIALERSGEQRVAEAEWHAVEAFTSGLLRGDQSPTDLERRADVLGFRLDAQRVVGLVGSRVPGGIGLGPKQLARILTGPDSPSAVLAAPCGDDVAVIVELPAGLRPRQGLQWARLRLADGLARIGHRAGLFAAVSSIIRAPGDDRRAYGESQQVLACMRTHLTVPGDQVLAADDLGAGRLMLVNTPAGEASQFCQDTVGPLLSEDGKSQDLLETLAAFMDSGRSIKRAAELLSVHTNTIRYRMTRIEKLTGLDVTADSNSQLTAQVAVLILRLTGQLSPDQRPPADSGAV
jgi:sugar diacid utilization regulator